ncbi:MAG: hypothetical protein ACKN9V_01270 [Pseudomonadota bacterium]
MRIFAFILVVLLLEVPSLVLGDEGLGHVLDGLLKAGGVPLDPGAGAADQPKPASDLEKALRDLLALNKNDEPNATPETMREFIKKYLEEEQSDETKKLILETIPKDENWNHSSNKPLKTFMEELLKLPTTAQGKTLSALEKLDTSLLLKHIGELPKGLQHRIVERGFNDLKPGQDNSALERAVVKSDFPLTAAQAQLMINTGSNRPAIFEQFFKLVPDAKQQVFSWMKEKDSASHRDSQLASFVSLLKNGHVPLTPEDSERLIAVLKDTGTNSSQKNHAFRALEVVDGEKSKQIFSDLSSSSHSSDRITAARLLDEKDNRRTDILLGTLRTIASASPEELLEIKKELPRNAKLTLNGTVEELKTIFEKGKNLDDSFGLDLMEAALRGLGKSAKAEDLLPFLQKATSEVIAYRSGIYSRGLFIAGVEILNERSQKERDLFKGTVTSLFSNFMTHMNSEESDSFTLNALAGSVSLLKKYPELIKEHSTQLKTSLEGGTTRIPYANLALLTELKDPALIPLFASKLTKPDLAFDASYALGTTLKAHPDKADEALKTQLTGILAAHDKYDELRLYLRQNLPTPLVRELDNRVFKIQTEQRPVNAAEKASEAAQAIARQLSQDSSAAIGPRALAFRSLLTSSQKPDEIRPQLEQFLNQILEKSSGKATEVHSLTLADMDLDPEAEKRAAEFASRVSGQSRGVGWDIHEGVQLNQLMNLAESKGISLAPSLVTKVRSLTDQQFNRISNAGNPVIRFGDDSSFSTFAQASMVLSLPQGGLPDVGRAALKNLERRRVEDPNSVSFSYDYNNRAPTTSVESSGRAVTAQFAIYQQASEESRPQEAQRLLTTLKNFEENFSQLFELPLQTNRTHNRHPEGQQMATYYGFGNAPYAADAIRRLASDSSLSAEQRDQLYRVSERVEGRLLNLVNQDGRLYPIQRENFAHEQAAYNLLTDLTLKTLREVNKTRPTKAPQTRLLGSVVP